MEAKGDVCVSAGAGGHKWDEREMDVRGRREKCCQHSLTHTQSVTIATDSQTHPSSRGTGLRTRTILIPMDEPSGKSQAEDEVDESPAAPATHSLIPVSFDEIPASEINPPNESTD